jgi:hypothetical protein
LNPRLRRRTEFGATALFVVLYVASLFLPSWVEYSFPNSRIVSTTTELTAELERDSYSWVLGGERLQPTSQHDITTASGIKLDGPPPKTTACTSRSAPRGLQVLTNGWLGALFSIFAWYANILAFASVILRALGQSPKMTLALTLGAFLLGFDTLRLHSIPVPGGSMVPGPTVDHLESGYYVWQLSLVVLFLSNVVAVAFRDERSVRAAASKRTVPPPEKSLRDFVDLPTRGR